MKAQKQFLIALYFFAAIALLGLTLRLYPIYDLGINFAWLLHAHSHVAFLGWIHGAFISFISYIFLKDKLHTKTFKWIYAFTITTIVGMYFSFPLQGYKLFSIIFLSLFLVSTYFFLYYFFKHKKEVDTYPVTYKFIKAGLFLQFLSSLSPWSLVFILKAFGKKSHFYKYDIYYYLHFQYNGWFLFAMIGLILFMLERRNIRINPVQAKRILYLMLVAVFLGYFSNTLWAKPGMFYNILALVGGASEIFALFLLLRILLRYHRFIEKTISPTSYLIFKWVLAALFFKAGLQFMGSFQYYADLSFLIRDFVIGYLHLIMLGIFTPFLLILANELSFIKLKKSYFYIFYSGFIITESIIIGRAIFTWFKIVIPPEIYTWALFIFTFWMFIGIILLVFKSKNQDEVLQGV